MAQWAVLAGALSGFIPDATTFVINALDKIGFDLDYTGRNRQIRLIQEQASSSYKARGLSVNIAIWNMHIDEDHNFEDILESGVVQMGKGGGFRIVVFRGNGWLKNKGSRGTENWLCSGNQHQKDNVIRFGRV